MACLVAVSIQLGALNEQVRIFDRHILLWRHNEPVGRPQRAIASTYIPASSKALGDRSRASGVKIESRGIHFSGEQ